MRGRFLWIVGIAVAVAVVAVVAGATWLLGDDDSDAPSESEALMVASSPVGTSLPAASSPAANAAAVSELEDLWTPERVEAALGNPARRPGVSGKGDEGPVGSVPSGNAPGASADADAEPREAEVDDTAPRSGAAVQRACAQPPVRPAVAGYPFQRSCYRGRLDANPARTSGKLIFWDDRNYDGNATVNELFNCTATVGTSDNQSVVMTAGHCVVTPATETPDGEPRWHRSISFVPSYAVRAFYRALQSDTATFRRFARTQMWWGLPIGGSNYQVAWSPTGWINRAYWSHDFAAVVIAPRVTSGSQQTIQTVLGSQGWDMTGKNAAATVRLLGFPVDRPFDGRVLFECRGSSKLVRYANDPAPELGVGCDMTGGSSGGPWLAAVNPKGLGRIVSVNSNGNPKIPVMYGPRLSNLHIDAMRKAESTAIPSE